MKVMIAFLVGALLISVLYLMIDIRLAKQKAQTKVIFMTVQQECTARVGEVWAASGKGVKPRLDLSLALALCKEGEKMANRILVRLNQERPRYKDGAQK